MARQSARRRHIAIGAASVLAFAAVISGSLAVAGEDAGSASRGRGPAQDKGDRAPGANTPATPGAPAAPGAPGVSGAPGASAPSGPVSSSIAHETEGGGKTVALTIDDGPDPVWTPKVLAVLKKYGAKATFCMIGPQAKARPDLVRKVVADGHRLCDHSVDHNTEMDKRSEDYQSRQILDAQKMISEAAGGAPVCYYRAPGGAFTPYSRGVAAAHGMRPLGWNVDTNDWKRPGTQAIVETVKKEVPNGPIVLFHDGGGDRSQTVAALEEIVPWLKAEGYVFAFPKV
ncbi:polysaccharide deacetylase family protein [Streptomyces sp. NPDC049577]|uniref:polysaccharide deacetylase family protein n=1 Tax=Streptomyces sp. NPDC049577 TaxID=3155153 RepID=UPI0034128E83